ncbi:GGDEF domain-containing protein [Ferdinandcohnia quinoae]|uniref:Diguanylate cyclase n=1 Tax=Fredinandcohnia quinoae TaxID=2918902 RepID=A0AAW5E247_9BACI|nr:diguanylate cyclase [Fredinandcohnia sp. SECRCQ15]MCH1624147.1 diguanylate cyclase [Fredinandcohnia sp. SECRCQ15]
MIKGATSESGEKRAEQIEKMIRNVRVMNDESEISVKSSIGVADNLNGEITTFVDLFNLADTALYKAKQNGKNQIYIK